MERLILCGGGHVSLQVAQIAQRLDFALAVIDDRPEFANPDRFPMARVLCMPFLEALDQLGGGAQDYYVILTRGHVFDRTCLEWVLRHERAYVGMIGSRIKVAAVMTALEEAGWPRSVLEQVYSPIGLEIGAQTPAEIAVSIAGRAYPGPRPAGSRRGAAAGGAGGAVHHREKERLPRPGALGPGCWCGPTGKASAPWAAARWSIRSRWTPRPFGGMAQARCGNTMICPTPPPSWGWCAGARSTWNLRCEDERDPAVYSEGLSPL